MADDPKKAATPGEEDEPVQPDETVEGGRFIVDAVLRKGKHYGGRVVNAEGETLAEFEPNEENTGQPQKAKVEAHKAAPTPPAPNQPAKPEPPK